MNIKTRLLERLQGRIDNAIRNSTRHPDPHVREEAAITRDAYRVALMDVESLFKEYEDGANRLDAWLPVYVFINPPEEK